MREPCKSCRHECSGKMSEENRKKLFESYWGLNNTEKQGQFIANCTQCEEPKRHRPRKGNEGNRRQTIITYFLPKVCQNVFLNTFDISRKVVRTAISKQKDRNIANSGNRGKTASNKKYNDDLMEKVKTHKVFLSCRVTITVRDQKDSILQVI